LIVWIDLEATGLVATAAAVLEVAAIVTDDRLREVGRFHRVVHWPRAELLAGMRPADPGEASAGGIDRAVVELHARNGLWAESARSSHDVDAVDLQLAEFLVRTASEVGPLDKPQVAGSSIWYDRGLMRVWLPRALEGLHYRSIDVTTLSELARRFWPGLHDDAPRKREIHRAMPDIEDSLALCRYYVDRIGVLLDVASRYEATS
jgi:oligoribonuclease